MDSSFISIERKIGKGIDSFFFLFLWKKWREREGISPFDMIWQIHSADFPKRCVVMAYMKERYVDDNW